MYFEKLSVFDGTLWGIERDKTEAWLSLSLISGRGPKKTPVSHLQWQTQDENVKKVWARFEELG